jgi:adenine-specific DNA-methyltransferase
MPIERIKPAFHFEKERIEQLKQIAPEAFADGKINWETLQEVLGNFLEEEEFTAEHFGLFWPGKRAARKIASIPSEGTLMPCPGEGVDEENTGNIFIEGENLEVLKLLQKSYANRIKMIYIDPPYNTGSDFIYEDDFTETIEEYLRRTGQLDEETKPVSANTKADGRFHSKWLSMMYPRLRLARNLLREDGLIFISIDDNEISNLNILMNEVFGEENFEGLISWRRRHNQPNDKTKVIGKVAEYILCYSKLSEYLKLRGTFNGVPLSTTRMNEYKNPDKDPNGAWTSNPWKAAKGRGGSRYKLKTSTGKIFDETWYGNQETFNDLLRQGRVHFTDNGNGYPRIKIYLKEAMESGQSAINFFTHDKFGSNQDASSELADLFNNTLVFNNPKPTKLLESLIQIGTNEHDFVLDFFGGSGSTAHALFKSEALKKMNRKFIVVQLPELINEDDEAGKNAIKLGYTNISEITLDRIRKVSKKIKKENGKKDIDFGFKKYALSYSNYKLWKDYIGSSTKELELQFENNTTPLIDDWKPQNLLIEILLIEGFPLDSKLELQTHFKKNEVAIVTSDFCEHKLLVCLDKKIYADTIKNLELNEDDIFICLDSAITDQDKLTLQDKGLIKTI